MGPLQKLNLQARQIKPSNNDEKNAFSSERERRSNILISQPIKKKQAPNGSPSKVFKQIKICSPAEPFLSSLRNNVGRFEV